MLGSQNGTFFCFWAQGCCWEEEFRIKNLPSKILRGSVGWQRRVPIENHFCLVKDTIPLITDFFFFT